MLVKPHQEESKSKGQAETPFVLSLVVILAFISFMSVLIVARYPQFAILSSFDMGFFTANIIIVAGTCVIATGLPCAAALAFFSFTQFFIVQNTVLYSLVFVPLTVTIAYVMARLGRGGA